MDRRQLCQFDRRVPGRFAQICQLLLGNYAWVTVYGGKPLPYGQVYATLAPLACDGVTLPLLKRMTRPESALRKTPSTVPR